MPNLRMATAEEFFAMRNPRFDKNGFLRKPKTEHLDYMELMADYADYVCGHEKMIDRTGNQALEKLDIKMHMQNVLRVGDLEEYRNPKP